MEIEHIKISLFKAKDNLDTSGKVSCPLIRKIWNKEIIIKPADFNGSIIVVMSPYYYWNIHQSHISDTTHYRILNDTDLSNNVQQRVTQFADKHKSMLKLKEYNHLTKRKQKISNLYMLLNLNKSKWINEIIQKEKSDRKNVEENIIYKARPIIAGPVYHTSGISNILHIIMVPSLAMISHIAQDFFHFKNILNKNCPNGTTLSTCYIKSLYTNIPHDLFIQ